MKIKMNVNINSIHARLYRWFYNTDEMPNNLCSYFWATLFSLVWAIPHLILLFPLYVRKWFSKYSFSKRSKFHSTEVEGISNYGIIILILSSVFLLSQPILYLFSYGVDNDFLKMGIFLWSCIVLLFVFVGGGFIYESIKERQRERRWRKRAESKPEKQHGFLSLTWEFIKAKKNKYCPKLDWNNE